MGVGGRVREKLQIHFSTEQPEKLEINLLSKMLTGNTSMEICMENI